MNIIWFKTQKYSKLERRHKIVIMYLEKTHSLVEEYDVEGYWAVHSFAQK